MQSHYKRETTCCFTGHRFVPPESSSKLNKALQNAITELMEAGVSTFISGGALGFDTLAAQGVLDLKRSGADINLVMILPCRDQYIKWSSRDRSAYEEILKVADDVIFLNDKYVTGCMHQRNRVMVSQSGHCIAYYDGRSGGTAHTIGLAKEQELNILNIFEDL
ncbi:MAG: DUF1273 family protein [Clostridia bacterium]|nr:DUF1273 family protein [Clostridia bacterium]